MKINRIKIENIINFYLFYFVAFLCQYKVFFIYFQNSYKSLIDWQRLSLYLVSSTLFATLLLALMFTAIFSILNQLKFEYY